MTSLDTHDPPPAHEVASLAETPNDALASHPNEDEDEDEGQGEVLRSQSAAVSSVHTTVPAVCQQLYVDSGNDKMVLYLLSIGLKNNNSEPFVAFDKQPWCLLPKNQFRSPKNSDLVKDIRRRADLSRNMTSLPRPTNWTRMQMMEWLDSNPVSEACDVDFLTSEVLRLDEVFHRMQSERQQLELSADATNVSGGRGTGTGPWRGNVPYMRIIMCLTEDDVKSLLLARANTLSRAELDARNSISRYVSCRDLCTIMLILFTLLFSNTMFSTILFSLLDRKMYLNVLQSCGTALPLIHWLPHRHVMKTSCLQ